MKNLIIISACGLLFGCGQGDNNNSVKKNNDTKVAGTQQTNLDTSRADEEAPAGPSETGDVSQEDSSAITLSCQCRETGESDYGIVTGGSFVYSGGREQVEGSGDTPEEAAKEAKQACQAIFPDVEEGPYFRACYNGAEMVCQTNTQCEWLASDDWWPFW